jgi:8-oxo-dGTP diphosphatase
MTKDDPSPRLHALIEALVPLDELESEHRREASRWLDSTVDLYRRRSSPVEPRQHLVSYFLVVDTTERLILLGDHLKSGLWLPSGGHVEPGEDPVETVRRECLEELAIEARFHPALGPAPLFITVTDTLGADPHRDVSLWFVLETSASSPLHPDPSEYRAVRWWSVSEIRSAAPTLFDPHMHRMLDKVETTVWG